MVIVFFWIIYVGSLFIVEYEVVWIVKLQVVFVCLVYIQYLNILESQFRGIVGELCLWDVMLVWDVVMVVQIVKVVIEDFSFVVLDIFLIDFLCYLEWVNLSFV